MTVLETVHLVGLNRKMTKLQDAPPATPDRDGARLLGTVGLGNRWSAAVSWADVDPDMDPDQQ
jgi:hypothetical protein